MSSSKRIAVVAEGPTDHIVIEAILASALGTEDFVLTLLQPENCLAFGKPGGGWTGVYRWCQLEQKLQASAPMNSGPWLPNHDMLIIHLDADVSTSKYEDDSIKPSPTDLALPCATTCPPASASVDALRKVVLSWIGCTTLPADLVLCMPSMSMEAWVVAALFPADLPLANPATFECLPSPEKRLGQQPKQVRISKRQADYRLQQASVTAEWPQVASILDEAQRFHSELLAATQASPP